MRGKGRILVAGVAVLALAAFAGPPHTVAVVRAATPSDFNGDGYVDLAIGVPHEDLGAKEDAGAVNVLYGSATGLTASGGQRWTQDSPGVKGLAEGWADRFGWALASGDFNRDGYADLAIGVPGDRFAEEGQRGSGGRVGAVTVMYGSVAGLTAAGDQRLVRPDLPPPPDEGSGFGTALAAGDFDGDGYWDLAVTALEVVGGDHPSGTVSVLFGGTDGLRVAGAQVVVQPLTGGPDDAWHGEFGRVVVAGDLDGDAYADLATSSSLDAARAVAVYHGTPAGLGAATPETWSQDSPGVPGDSGSDQFGRALAIGDFNGDGFGDLSVGAFDEEVGVLENAGAVYVLYGTPDGPTAADSQLWHADVPGVPGVAEAGERLGHALAAGDFDGDGRADLAIGVPGERPGGMVLALYGSVDGLAAAGAKALSQDSPGVPGTREGPDMFGAALAAADYGRSGRDDLAIGAKYEMLRGLVYAGLVNVLYSGDGGLSGTGAQAWSQGSLGVQGTIEKYDQFGYVLSP